VGHWSEETKQDLQRSLAANVEDGVRVKDLAITIWCGWTTERCLTTVLNYSVKHIGGFA